MSVKCTSPYTLSLYINIGVYKGIHGLISFVDIKFDHSNLSYLILSYANMQHQILPYADSNIYYRSNVAEQ